MRSLLVGMPFENLKPVPRQQTTSHLKRKLVYHQIEEMEGPARDVRRRCAGCYENIRQDKSREASLATAEKIKTFCADRDNFCCLDCFNEKHYHTK